MRILLAILIFIGIILGGLALLIFCIHLSEACFVFKVLFISLMLAFCIAGSISTIYEIYKTIGGNCDESPSKE